MICLPEMLVKPAEVAGMNVPDDPDSFDQEQFPHFSVFCKAQIGAPMPTWTSHWRNAEVIAAVPDDKIKSITFDDLKELGYEWGHAND